MTGEKSVQTLNIAHRGGARLWPENTLMAFRNAIAAGVDGIEFDMQLSRDGELVIHHDADLNPALTRKDGAYLARPTPRIDALTWDELQQYDIGRPDPDSAYARALAPDFEAADKQPIARLAEIDALVTATAKHDFRLYAELKTDMRRDAAQAEALSTAYADALHRLDGAAHHIAVSFDWRCLTYLRAMRPDMPHAYTTLPFSDTDPAHENAADERPDSRQARLRAASKAGAAWWGGFDWRDMDGASHGEKVLRAIHAAGGQGWFAYWRDINEETMGLAQDLGLRVSAWTVNQPSDMKRLARLGVDAVITDRPDILKTL